MPKYKRTLAVTADQQLIDLADPDYSLLTLNTFATGLSNTARYSGQSTSRYSVAQHTLVVLSLTVMLCQQARMPYPEGDVQCLAALLHDAPECLLGDPTGPSLKVDDQYAEAWERLALPLHKGFAFNAGLATPYSHGHYPLVRLADIMAMELERRAFFPKVRPWIGFRSVETLDKLLDENDIPLQPCLTSPLWPLVLMRVDPLYMGDLLTAYVHEYQNKNLRDQKPN